MKTGQKQHDAQKKFYLWLAVAAVIHFFVIFASVFFQIWGTDHRLKPKIVSVTLVSLHGSMGSEQAISSPALVQEPQPITPIAPKIVEERPPASKPAPKLATKPATKQIQLNQALARIQQRVDKQTPSTKPSSITTLNSALARIQQKISTSGKPAVAGSVTVADNRTGAGKGYGAGVTSEPYKAAVASIIQQNWEFSKTLLKNSEGMAVYVRINILANGTISQIIFDRKAISEYLNNSVKKAIEKSSPLPILPKEQGGRDVWIGFVFSPEGLAK